MTKRDVVKANTKIYLGSPFFNDVQKERVEVATKHLEKNPTLELVHFPFDHQYGGASIENKEDGLFGSLEWQVGTYQNDLTGMETADAGVFLYDIDNLDDGSAFEIGFMRALHKPVVVVLLGEKPLEEYELNLMIAQGGTYFINDMAELETYDFNHYPSNQPSIINII